MVRVPEAAGQVRSAPVKALRGFFAGIGQLLITADRFKAEEAQREQAQSGQPERDPAGLEQSEPDRGQHDQAQRIQAHRDRPERGRAEPARAGSGPDRAAGRYEPLTAPRGSAAARRGRDARAAGRHRAAGLQGPAASAQTPARRFRSLDSTGNVRLLTADVVALDQDDEPPTAAELPVTGYDQLTLASLRSRLRYLDAAQLRMLAAYERATANRADVIGMFERRLAKLQAQAGHAP